MTPGGTRAQPAHSGTFWLYANATSASPASPPADAGPVAPADTSPSGAGSGAAGGFSVRMIRSTGAIETSPTPRPPALSTANTIAQTIIAL